MPPLEQIAILVGASALAGAINSVAGGGTLLTFPALLAAGQLTTVANATSTVALWPGQLSSLWALREEMRQHRKAILPLAVIGVAGGAAGAHLLTVTPESFFKRLVPYLILLATVIFLVQEPLSKWQKARAERLAPADDAPPAEPAAGGGVNLSFGVGLFLFGIALYGGYFGAGIGILTLAAFGLMGMTDIHQMNGVKAAFTLGINGVAAVLFIFKGLVDWKIAGIMALGSLFGGYAGAGVARRMGQKNVRILVILIGFGLSLSLFLKR
jgi:uncharacterized protein